MSEPKPGLTTKELSKGSPAFFTTLFGIAGATVTGVVAKVTETCPDLLAQWPALATAGLVAGLGFWMKGPRAK